MFLTVDITKKTKEDYGHPPREGAYLHGLLMEGKMPLGAHAGLSHLEPFALGFKLVFVLCLFKPGRLQPRGSQSDTTEQLTHHTTPFLTHTSAYLPHFWLSDN